MSELLQAKPTIMQNLLSKVAKFQKVNRADFYPLHLSNESLTRFNAKFYNQIASFGKKMILFNLAGLSFCLMKTRFIWNQRRSIIPSLKYWALFSAGFFSMTLYHNNSIQSKLNSDINDLIIDTVLLNESKNEGKDSPSNLRKRKAFMRNQLRFNKII